MKKKELSLQEYLSLGYIYLIVLGIITDVIAYKLLGINILNYSSILDILISPISIIAYNFIVLLAFSICLGFSYLILEIVIPKLHAKLRDKKWYQKTNNIEKLDKRYLGEHKKGNTLQFMAFFILSMFLGFGVGKGLITSSRIEEGDLKIKHQLVFNDGEERKIEIVGQNSSYIFYVTEGNQEISISPNHNVKEIIRIAKKRETDPSAK